MIIPAPAPVLTDWLAPFASAFTAPTLRSVLVLIAGAILTPGRRTVTSALSIMGLREIATFTTFHRVLNRNRWAPRDLARRLLHQLVETFVPAASIAIRSAPATAILSKPQACAGSASCFWLRSPGPVAYGRCRS